MDQGYSELAGANDESLIELARQGERDAIDVLFSRHMPILQRTALKFLHNEAEAEDVVQDSLTSAFVHLSQYAGRAQFRTWLLSILLNTARTRVRGRKGDRNLSLEEELGDSGAAPILALRDPRPGPDQVMAAQEQQGILQEALNYLSPDFRAAYYLCYVKGLSAKEAAARLGVNQQTLKVRLFRGKRKLTTRLSIIRGIKGAKSEAHLGARRSRLCRAGAMQSSAKHSCLGSGESPIQ
ncbi:MAG TPA: sigma-70 family RNA polymerase sigma factor [Candidatus Acidoferrales bacterium]|nr:sigma-70 family RNA polymerase sigma factor [Candidatus Acidoferrales bacterium]